MRNLLLLSLVFVGACASQPDIGSDERTVAPPPKGYDFVACTYNATDYASGDHECVDFTGSHLVACLPYDGGTCWRCARIDNTGTCAAVQPVPESETCPNDADGNNACAVTWGSGNAQRWLWIQ